MHYQTILRPPDERIHGIDGTAESFLSYELRACAAGY